MSRTARAQRSDAMAVIAGYPSMEAARRAFIALQNQGVDAGDVRLTGEHAEEAERRATLTRTRDRIDRRLAGHVGRRVAAGAIGGAVLGAIIGVIVAWILVVAMDDVDRTGAMFALITAVFAAIGAVLSVLLTFERSVGIDDTWQIMLQDVSSEDVCVAVRVRDEDEIERVLSDLHDQEPPQRVEIRRVTASGVHTVRPTDADDRTAPSSDEGA